MTMRRISADEWGFALPERAPTRAMKAVLKLMTTKGPTSLQHAGAFWVGPENKQALFITTNRQGRPNPRPVNDHTIEGLVVRGLLDMEGWWQSCTVTLNDYGRWYTENHLLSREEGGKVLV